jgi:hypothetical protein
MYSITEILIQLLFVVFVFNLKIDMTRLKQYLSFFYENVNELILFYYFICENNPLLLNYLDDTDITLNTLQDEDRTNDLKKQEEKFENKYLEKFKKFPNEFKFDEQELNEQKELSETIKIQFEKNKFESIQKIQEELSKIENIINNGGFREKLNDENDSYTASINSNEIDLLLNYFDLTELYEDEPEEVVFEELYEELLKKKEELLKEMLEQETMTMTEDEASLKARDTIINNLWIIIF